MGYSCLYYLLDANDLVLGEEVEFEAQNCQPGIKVDKRQNA
jgi:hypothetical protein